MTLDFTVTRAGLVAALTALLPHAGKWTEDTPELGKVRWSVTGDGLVLWASQVTTHAAAVVPACDESHLAAHGPVGAQWDTSVAVVKKILGVFKVSATRGDPDGGEISVHLGGDSQLVLTEAGGLLPGESLRVPRWDLPPAASDGHPDVPALVTAALSHPLDRGGSAAVDAGLLAPFVPSAKAYGGFLRVRVVGPPVNQVVVSSGKASFIGLLPRMDATPGSQLREEDLAALTKQTSRWRARLKSLSRPVKARLDVAQADALMREAADALAEHGEDAELRVVTVTVGDDGAFQLADVEPDDEEEDDDE